MDKMTDPEQPPVTAIEKLIEQILGGETLLDLMLVYKAHDEIADLHLKVADRHEWQDVATKVSAERDTLRSQFNELKLRHERLVVAARPFVQMADKFDVEPYKASWPDSMRLSEDETVTHHNYLTLGDCRKIKAALSSSGLTEKREI